MSVSRETETRRRSRLKRARTFRFSSTRSSSCSRPSAAASSWTRRSARAATREALLERGPDIRLLGIDRDPDALALARGAARALSATASSSCAATSGISIASSRAFRRPTGSSRTSASPRCSSTRRSAASRFAATGRSTCAWDESGRSAADIVATASVEELTRIFREYGEERMAAKIARGIVAERARGPITTTRQLARIVAEREGRPRKDRSGHPRLPGAAHRGQPGARRAVALPRGGRRRA